MATPKLGRRRDAVIPSNTGFPPNMTEQEYRHRMGLHVDSVDRSRLAWATVLPQASIPSAEPPQNANYASPRQSRTGAVNTLQRGYYPVQDANSMADHGFANDGSIPTFQNNNSTNSIPRAAVPPNDIWVPAGSQMSMDPYHQSYQHHGFDSQPDMTHNYQPSPYATQIQSLNPMPRHYLGTPSAPSARPVGDNSHYVYPSIETDATDLDERVPAMGRQTAISPYPQHFGTPLAQRRYLTNNATGAMTPAPSKRDQVPAGSRGLPLNALLMAQSPAPQRVARLGSALYPPNYSPSTRLNHTMPLSQPVPRTATSSLYYGALDVEYYGQSTTDDVPYPQTTDYQYAQPQIPRASQNSIIQRRQSMVQPSPSTLQGATINNSAVLGQKRKHSVQDLSHSGNPSHMNILEHFGNGTPSRKKRNLGAALTPVVPNRQLTYSGSPSLHPPNPAVHQNLNSSQTTTGQQPVIPDYTDMPHINELSPSAEAVLYGTETAQAEPASQESTTIPTDSQSTVQNSQLYVSEFPDLLTVSTDQWASYFDDPKVPAEPPSQQFITAPAGSQESNKALETYHANLAQLERLSPISNQGKTEQIQHASQKSTNTPGDSQDSNKAPEPNHSDQFYLPYPSPFPGSSTTQAQPSTPLAHSQNAAQPSDLTTSSLTQPMNHLEKTPECYKSDPAVSDPLTPPSKYIRLTHPLPAGAGTDFDRLFKDHETQYPPFPELPPFDDSLLYEIPAFMKSPAGE